MIRLSLIIFSLITLVGCNSMNKYIYNDTHVYWVKSDYSDINYTKGKKVPMYGVDLSSFRVLDEKIYAVDNKAVYYSGIPIAFAEPGSFKLLKNGYAIDKNHVFLQGEIIYGASPKQVSFFNDNISVIKAGEFIFYEYQGFNPCDVKSFLPFKNDKRWSRDAKCVYYKDRIVATADANTFMPLNYQYAKDKNGIFYESTRLDDADLATFKVIDWHNFSARDKLGCYQSSLRVDCENIDVNKPIYNISSDYFFSKTVKGFRDEKARILSQAQDDQIAHVSMIVDHLAGDIGSPEVLLAQRFDKIDTDYGFTLITTDLIPNKVSFKYLGKREGRTVFNVYNSTVYGLMQLEFDLDGEVIKEPVYTGGSYNFLQYNMGKCAYRVGQCTEYSKVVLTSGEYSQQNSIDVIYNEGVWYRNINLSNGSTMKEVIIYNRYGLPVYFSTEHNGILNFEMVREDLLPIMLK